MGVSVIEVPKPPKEEAQKSGAAVRRALLFLARMLLTAVGAVLYATGYVTRKVVFEAPRWIAAATRLGWRDAS